jgi:hypothetical protein
MENKNAYAYIAIVAIVAVVAMVVLISGGSKTTVTPTISSGDLTGEAVRTTSNYEVKDSEKPITESIIEELKGKGILKEDSTIEEFHFMEEAELEFKSNMMIIHAPGGPSIIACGGCSGEGSCSGNEGCSWVQNGYGSGWKCKGRCGSMFSGCGGCGVSFPNIEIPMD